MPNESTLTEAYARKMMPDFVIDSFYEDGVYGRNGDLHFFIELRNYFGAVKAGHKDVLHRAYDLFEEERKKSKIRAGFKGVTEFWKESTTDEHFEWMYKALMNQARNK